MENSNKRVLIWTASYPPVLGGLQTVSRQLAHGLAENGYQVIVLTNRYPKSLPAQEEEGPVRIERISHYRSSIAIKSPIDLIRYCRNALKVPTSRRQILSLLKSFQPDIINIHFPDPQLAYLPLIQTNFKGKLVVSLHGHEVLRWFRKNKDGGLTSELRSITTKESLERVRLVQLLQDGDVVTACSGWLLEMSNHLFKAGKGRQVITYNSIDSERFNLVESSVVSTNYIFSAGRLDQHKGFDLLILAIASLKTDYPNIKLEIAGEGKAFKLLQDIIKAHQLELNVRLIGRLSQEDLSKKLVHSTLVVIPSRRETFGISVLEGIASGKPVVATSVGGIPEAAGGLANLVPPTVNGLAAGIRDALQKDQSSTKRTALIAQHLTQFTPESFIAKYKLAIDGND